MSERSQGTRKREKWQCNARSVRLVIQQHSNACHASIDASIPGILPSFLLAFLTSRQWLFRSSDSKVKSQGMNLGMGEPFRRKDNQKVRYSVVHDRLKHSDALFGADDELRLPVVFV